MSDRITMDLHERNLSPICFICLCKETGRLQVVAYDKDGLVSHITREVDTVGIYEKLGGRMIKPLLFIGEEV